MKLLDIKDFQPYSSVSDTDRILMVKGATDTDASITIGLLMSLLANKLLLPTIKDGVWYIGDKSTGISAVGKSPIIKDQIWWVWDESKNDYASTGQTVNSTFVLTKEAIEGLLTGNVISHEHSEYTVPTLTETPTESTLTWTDDDNNLYLFYVGQLCRVADESSENGYKFYQLYNILDGKAVWGEISGKGGVGQTYPNTINGEIFNDYANNIANGKNAHAEGQETNATGPRAHAEGYLTKVFAAEGHAEGRETWCLGAQGHVEGFYSIVFGATSHVEGCSYDEDYGESEATKIILGTEDEEIIRTILSNSEFFTRIYNEDSGYYTLQVNNSFFEKYIAHCSFGERSHVEGTNNICTDNSSHVEGYSNICGNKIASHGHPSVNNANHIEGSENVLHSDLNRHYAIHIEGRKNTFNGNSEIPFDVYGVHIEGANNTVDVTGNSFYTGVHVGGEYSKIKSGRCSFLHGYNLNAEVDYQVAFGKYNQTWMDGKKILFAYGIGSSDTNRKNAISVFEDGTVSIPGLIGVSVDEQIKPLNDKIEKQSKIISNLESCVNDLSHIIAKLHPELKVFVVGDRLVTTSLLDAEVSESTMTINDNDTSVADDVLVFGEYVPEPEPEPDQKAYVENNILYFSESAPVSITGDTLIITDSDIYVDSECLTIQ